MRVFYGIVHKDEDSAYGVSFPQLPGVFSAADADEDIAFNAGEALELYFEDADEVDAWPVERVVEAARDDLAAGAFLVAVPHVKSTMKPVRANISLDSGLLTAIDVAAGDRKLTRSAFIAQAALYAIRNNI
ncbi:MAG: CopG family transcriptional regulator [Sphingobium sp. 66-54]|nr:MAG: CopG family transcriptional regulator [Sphingobium sp. 66-54]